MKNLILPLLLIAVFSCKTDENEQIKSFLTEWSVALTQHDETVQRFYDPGFAFPKDVFLKDISGLNFTLDVEHSVIIRPTEDATTLQVFITFKIAYPDKTVDNGTLELAITKTENSFLILQMSQHLARKLKEYEMDQFYEHQLTRLDPHYDSLLGDMRAMAKKLRQHYDSVVFYTEVGEQVLFYVVKGSWEYPYDYEAANQRDGGNYKMGVVTGDNKVIVPVEYTKIYNPDGSFQGMIEAEKDGVRGLYRTNGEAFIPVEFNGIYPTAVPGAFAQVRKGDSYGWVDEHGKVSFDSTSHENKTLFQSPIESNAVLQWKFNFPGPVKLLIDTHTDGYTMNGIIVYPSYIRDMRITSIANGFIFHETSDYGMGVTDLSVRFEKVESFSEKFFGLVSFFLESGADARGFHTAENDILVVDKNMTLLDRQEKMTIDYDSQNPCGDAEPSYRILEPGLYEANDGYGVYSYYKITAEGKVDPQKTNRRFAYTKFAKIDESYFNNCRYESISSDNGNVLLIEGISTEDLDIMRNEIFAEYGFKFKTPKWQKYFESQPWYKPQFDNVDHLLNETDKHNIKFILEYQRLHKVLEVKRDSINYGWAG